MHIAFLKHHFVRAKRAPLWGQCGGAAMGAVIALLLYGAYEWGGSRAASLLAPVVSGDETGDRTDLVVGRAKEIIESAE
ncbi:MAG: hypothetical protein AAB728_03390 [Patescibacteria group bacterium]